MHEFKLETMVWSTVSFLSCCQICSHFLLEYLHIFTIHVSIVTKLFFVLEIRIQFPNIRHVTVTIFTVRVDVSCNGKNFILEMQNN